LYLAGGTGSRLGLPYNKHKALVYDRQMIEYPIATMKELGVDKPVIVTNLSSVPLKGGYPHEIQEHPLGMPDAILAAETRVKDNFYAIAGDVYLDPAPEPSDEPTLYWHESPDAINHSVWNPETNEVIEKPTRDIGCRAIIFYMFGQEVFELIRTLKPSERGELEMTDIYKWYILNGVQMKEYKGFFADMGTRDGLLKVANHVQAL